MKPYMTNNEIQLFRKYLQKSNNYIEFGAGIDLFPRIVRT